MLEDSSEARRYSCLWNLQALFYWTNSCGWFCWLLFGVVSHRYSIDCGRRSSPCSCDFFNFWPYLIQRWRKKHPDAQLIAEGNGLLSLFPVFDWWGAIKNRIFVSKCKWGLCFRNLYIMHKKVYKNNSLSWDFTVKKKM